MALTSANILYGNFTITLLDGAVTRYTRSGLDEDCLEFSGESKEGNRGVEDGTEKFWLKGRKLNIKCTISELNTTDLAAIENGVDSVTILLSQPSKTITISQIDKCHAHIGAGFKTIIDIVGTCNSAQDWSDIFSIA